MPHGHWRNRVHHALWCAALRRSCRMSRRSNDDADRFRLRPGAPKQRGDAFVSKVLRQASKAANATGGKRGKAPGRSEEHTSALQQLMRIEYAVFCLKQKIKR